MSEQPGLPLTTGEGNTAADEAIAKLSVAERNEWIDKIVLTGDEARALLAECGRLREQLDAEKREHRDTAVWLSEANALLGKAREQLDAARQAVGRIAEQQPRTLANLRSHGVVFDGPLTADPNNWQDVAFTIYTDLCEVDTIARAALALDEETCRYCAGQGGRRRLVYSQFIGAGPQVHEGPWEDCWKCGGTGRARAALGVEGRDG